MAMKSEITPADAAFLIDGLQHVVSTVIINCGEIAAKKGSNPASIARRFSYIKNRYNLNIQMVATGSTRPSKVTGGNVVKRGRGRPPKNKSAEPTAGRKAAIKTLLDHDEIPSGRKPAAKSRLLASLPDEDAWDASFTSSER